MFMYKNTLGLLVVSGLLAAGTAFAQVSVDCGSGGVGLQTAIDGLMPSGVNVINVEGTCQEAVSIVGFQSLLIKSVNGATIKPPLLGNGDPNPAAISVVGGSNVKLCGLTIDGVNARTGITIDGSWVEGGIDCPARNLAVRNAETGIVMTENSVFRSNAGLTVENNAVRGFYVNASRLHLQGYILGGVNYANIRNNGNGALDAPERVRGGIFAGEGSTVYLYRVDVLDNRGFGVSGAMGSVVHLAFSNVTGNTGWGVLLSNNTTGQIAGSLVPEAPVTAVADNGAGGVLVTQRSALRLLNAPIVSGNTGANVSCTIGGDAFGDASNVPRIKKDCKSFETVVNE